MTIKLGDRVLVSSTTTGTGTYSLGAAATGYQTFLDALGISSGNTVTYGVVDNLETPTQWEICEGTITSGSPPTLTRTVIESSSGTSAISWTSGTRYIFSLASRKYLELPMAIGALSTNGVIKRTGSGAAAILASTTAGENMLTAADAAAQRTLLSVQPTASPAFTGILSAGSFRSIQVTIADDAIYTYTLPSGVLLGMAMLYAATANTGSLYLLAWFRSATDQNAVTSISAGALASVLSTSSITGTSGTDGHMILAVETGSSGQVIIINRTGATRVFNLIVF